MTPQTNHPVPKCAALILAAGESTRFGGRKQLADIHGVPMIRHTIDALASLPGLDRFVVLGAFADEIRPVIGTDCHIVDNPDWASGMGSSIAAGIGAIAKNGDYHAVLIALCDQVRLGRGDYQKLIGSFDGEHIIATRYSGGFGVPALFPASLFSELTILSGPSGARAILNGAVHDVIGLELEAARFDIDTRDDLNAVLSMPAGSTVPGKPGISG
ncbi:nucleotidyltransferase family protein [Thalassospira povalilytica]|uniref:nucleotidyltransferase family protein n=1 Tax=Thalassospira povalilytica TaxID=732237 RepID=UPI003AA823CF